MAPDFFTLFEAFRKGAELFLAADTSPDSMEKRCSFLESVIREKPADKAIVIDKAEEEGVVRMVLFNRNRKFVLEAFRYFIRSIDKELFFLSHPTLELQYQGDELVGINESDGKGDVYSLIYAEIPGGAEAEMNTIRDSLRRILSRLEYINNDYSRILEKVFLIQNQLESTASQKHAELHQDVKDFLHWVCQDNFIFLGYQSYDEDLNLNRDSPLGICALDEFLVKDKLLRSRLAILAANEKTIFDFKRRPDLSTYVSKGRADFLYQYQVWWKHTLHSRSPDFHSTQKAYTRNTVSQQESGFGAEHCQYAGK